MNGDVAIAKKISKIEIMVISALIILWLGTGLIIARTKAGYLKRMFILQDKLLQLEINSIKTDLLLKTDGQVFKNNTWTLGNEFSLFVIKDKSVILSTIPYPHKIEDIFNQSCIHVKDMSKKMSEGKAGRDWFKWGNSSMPQWVSWSVIGTPKGNLVIGILSGEEGLLKLSGYTKYRFLLMVCSGVLSGLILLSLIWALSWIRITHLYEKSIANRK